MAASTTASSPPSTESIISLTLPIATKLNHNNFLTWKSQILPIVHGYNLTKFLDSSPPAITIPSKTGDLTINSACLQWHRQDQLLLRWIRSSLTESVQAQVVSCVTTSDLWNYLQRSFSDSSRARLTNLRRQLQSAIKGSATCPEFLQKMRSLADELAFIGSPISDDDLVTATLNGLGPEFLPFVTSVTTTTRSDSINFADLHGLLPSHESLLQNQQSSLSISSPSAFSNQYSRSQPANPNFNNRNPINSFSKPLLPNPSFRTVNSTPTGPRPPTFNSQKANGPRPPKSQYTSQKPRCQICQKLGHSARFCWNRFDADPEYIPPPFQAYVAQSSPPRSSVPPNSTVSEWVLDSGATNHVTRDINNLSSFYSFEGMDNLQIGNGAGLTIQNIGSTSFILSHSLIHLHDILHVPSFTKNLISLSKLLLDNPHLTFQFSSSCCELKDSRTKKTLLQVTSSNGLFSIYVPLPPNPLHQALLGIRASADI